MTGKDYRALYQYGYRRSADQDATTPVRHRVVVVGAGPIGLAAAIDLAQRGFEVVLLDDNDKISEGSRAICFSKRALEVCDTIGVGERMVGKGVSWQVGKVFLDNALVHRFDLLPEPGYKRPAFINLQQYYLEAYLVERVAELPLIDLRWRNKVVGLDRRGDHVKVSIETPDGAYSVEADWLIAADGARSPLRDMLGLGFEGQVFNDRFLIVDIEMEADFQPERWFHFEPPFHKGQSVLLHKQPDNVWRIDFQLGAEADDVEERKPERVIPRLKAMLGEETPFKIAWSSVYTFQCKRMASFRHGRVLFAGDAAHQVSPFGARGANSGLEDGHNLCWKLAAVLGGEAGEALLDSYAFERELAADDNIGHSTRATDFISPKSPIARTFRNATLKLARGAPFAARLINSGRLSTPSHYAGSPLSTPDAEAWNCAARPGSPAPDAPVKLRDGRPGWLLDQLGKAFTLLSWDNDAHAVPGIGLLAVGKDIADSEGLLARRYGASPGTTYLIRPDQYVAARWKCFDAKAVAAAHSRALGRS